MYRTSHNAQDPVVDADTDEQIEPVIRDGEMPCKLSFDEGMFNYGNRKNLAHRGAARVDRVRIPYCPGRVGAETPRLYRVIDLGT
jgi:hypothetical protein